MPKQGTYADDSSISGLERLTGFKETGETASYKIDTLAAYMVTDFVAGEDGATWTASSGIPGSGTGKDDDLHLDTDNSNVYKKISGTWTFQVNIEGAVGPGIPVGGAANEVLKKVDGTDFNTVWASEAVSTVNTQSGDVVLDADDISDAATTNKFTTATDITKLSNITVTQAVNLDTIEIDVAVNNAKVGITQTQSDDVDDLKRDSNVGGKRGYKIPDTSFDWTTIPGDHAESIIEVRHDFDLSGGNIVIPSGVTLFFNGGIIKNFGTLTLDNTEIIATNSQMFDGGTSITGTLKNEYFDVSWLGVVNDGVTDNDTAFDLAVATGFDILVPQGDYVIGSISPLSNTKYLIHGNLISVNNEVININTKSNVTLDFDDIGSITGDNTNTAQEGITIDNSTNITVKGVLIDQCLNKGISIGGTSTYNYIYNAKVYGATGATGVGISVFSTSATHIDFDNCVVNDNRIGLSINGAQYCNVSNIMADGNTLMGVTVDGVITDSGDGGKYNNFTNIISNNNLGAIYGGIYLGNGSSHNNFTNTTCKSNSGAGIRLSGTNGVNPLDDNKFHNITVESNAVSGFVCSGSSNIQVSNITSSLNTGRGIQFFDCADVRVMSAYINTNTTEGVLYQSVDGSVDYGIVSKGNTYGIRVASGGALTAQNNVSFAPVLSGNSTSEYTGNSTSKIFGSTLFVSENKGSDSVADGATIAHGLATTPTRVIATGTVAGEIITVSTLNSTTFTVGIKTNAGAAGTTQTIYWEASL